MTHPYCVRAAFGAASLFVFLACSKSADQPLTSSASGPPPVVASTPSAESETAPIVTTEEASRVVAAWLDAQNRQHFADYESLYAERFHGVKRAADVATSFDRKGWLRDRKSMFRSPFRVTIESLSVRIVGDTAVADFQQTYEGQRYSDRGPKQLVMIDDGGRLKIAREELLRSDRGAGQFENGVSAADFSFIREIEGRRFWVVGGLRPSDRASPKALERVGVAAAFAKLNDTSTLPEELRQLIGVTVSVEPGMQPQCNVKLDDWGILAELEPHFSVRDRWSGLDDVKLTDEQVAHEIFGENGVSGTDQRFAVEITKATKRCPSARWGRLASLGSVEHFEVEEITTPEPALLAALKQNLRKTKGYKELERSYRESESDGSFRELMSDNLTLYRAQVGTDTYLISTFAYFTDCHEFNGEATQIWRMHGRTPVEVQTALPGAVRPLFALDINKDGMPEWVSETQMIAWDGRRYLVELDVTPMNYDCPC